VAFSAGQRLAASDLNRDAQSLSALIGAGTTTSASYVNMPATSSVVVTKASAATRLRIEFSCSSFVTVASTVTAFGVLVNGVDTDISRMFFNPASTHETCPTGVIYISGLAASAWTVQARWKRATGAAGTLTTDANDWITLDAQEVL
jgi:hypothetical protein